MMKKKKRGLGRVEGGGWGCPPRTLGEGLVSQGEVKMGTTAFGTGNNTLG